MDFDVIQNSVQEALNLLNANKHAEAAALLQSLLQNQAFWEHAVRLMTQPRPDQCPCITWKERAHSPNPL